MNYKEALKTLFYKSKVTKDWTVSDEEALKQWIIKVDVKKNYDKDISLITKAQNAINDLSNNNKAKESDLQAFEYLRKKYVDIFKSNRNELDKPSAVDVLTMDSISLDEINESMDDRKKILDQKYFQSIREIFTSSQNGIIITPTSGGLYPSNTPTSDYIDNLPDTHDPFADTGD